MEEKHCFQAEFTPDSSLVKECYRATLHRSLTSFLYIIFSVLLFGYAAYHIYSALNSVYSWRYELYRSLPIIAYCLLIAGLGIVMRSTLPGRLARKYMKQTSSLYGDAAVTATFFFDDDAIRLQSSTGERRETAYGQIISVYETAHGVVLRRKPNLFEMLNKETIRGGSLDDFQTFLREKMPEAKFHWKKKRS